MPPTLRAVPRPIRWAAKILGGGAPIAPSQKNWRQGDVRVRAQLRRRPPQKSVRRGRWWRKKYPFLSFKDHAQVERAARPGGARRIRKDIEAMSIRQTALFGLAYADALDGVKNRNAVAAAAKTISTATKKRSSRELLETRLRSGQTTEIGSDVSRLGEGYSAPGPPPSGRPARWGSTYRSRLRRSPAASSRRQPEPLRWQARQWRHARPQRPSVQR